MGQPGKPEDNGKLRRLGKIELDLLIMSSILPFHKGLLSKAVTVRGWSRCRVEI